MSQAGFVASLLRRRSAARPALGRTGAPYVLSRRKRMFDFAIAATALLSLTPLLLLCAVLIKLTSRGPVLYLQLRYGKNARPFTIYKFRTMSVLESTEDFRQATAGDRRVTRLGRALRRASVDELPQLWNVVIGDMSLVGPRPHPLLLDERYRALIAGYDRRFAVRPGITGLAQVSGARGETSHVGAMRRRIEFDVSYVDRTRFRDDCLILLKTAREVVVSRVAC